MKFKLIIVVTALCIADFCCTKPTEPAKTATITNVGYVVSNRDLEFHDGIDSRSNSTAFCGFFIQWKEDNIIAPDIKEARVTDQNGVYWIFDTSDVDQQNKYIGFYYCGSSDNPHRLSIGGFTAELTLQNGTVSTKTFTIGIPGDTLSGKFKYFYTENYTATPPEDFIPAVFRAQTVSGTINTGSSQCSISFVAPDQKSIYSGFLWFYDGNKKYVGRTREFFRKQENGAVSPWLNNGQAYYTDGKTANAAALTPEHIAFESGKSFGDIKKVVVVLCDGYQYAAAGHHTYYDYRSITRYYDLTSVQ